MQEDFAAWLRRCRKSLDLTREALGRRAHCSASAIRRLEAGNLRPSKQLAESLALVFEIPAEEREGFIRFARGDSHQYPATDFQSRTGSSPRSIQHTSLSRLPAPLTSFVGRKREVAAVCDLLQEEGIRLLTLTGPPGTGKTRLAIAAATKLANTTIFSDGIYFAPLASLSDPPLAPAAIAQALGLPEIPGKSPAEALRDYLRPRRLLLVLDNFEQIVSAAPFLADLLTASPGVKALITSREVLRVYGEHEFPVPPLELPDVHHLPTEKAHAYLGRYAAIQLFKERARASKPDFKLSPENAAHVARICAWLDGLPLAIEMAAAQVKWQPIDRLIEQLGDRLATLTGGPRDLSPRQQSLEGAIDWSYTLLDEDERQFFCLLGVFAGGCDEEAILDCRSRIASGGDGRYTRHVLRSLAEKSLLRQSFSPTGQIRYEMLETLRVYALDRLARRGELERARQAHAEYYLRLAWEAHPHLARGGDPASWLNRLSMEQGNLRVALEWAVASQGETATLGMNLAVALGQFWRISNQWSEGYWWLQRALDNASEAPALTRARALLEAGKLLHFQWRFEPSEPLLQQSLALYQELNDKKGIAEALLWLGRHAFRQKNYQEATRLSEQSQALFQETGDPYGLSLALRNLGDCARLLKDYERAGKLYEEALELSRQIDNVFGATVVLNSLGEMARLEGRLEEAKEIYEQELTLLEKSGDRLAQAISFHNLGHTLLGLGARQQAAACFKESLARYRQLENERGIALCLAGMGGVAALSGRGEQAARLLARAEATLAAGHFPLPMGPADQSAFERYLAAVKAQIDHPAFAAAWEVGEQMTLNQAIAYGLEVIGHE